ncbi:MAG: tellurite resistance TerB family protein [Synechococcus sp.]
MDSAEAFAAIALGAVACDGVLGREEAHALRRHLEYRTPYCERSDEQMGAMFDGLLTVLRQDEGLNHLINQALPVLNAQQQETSLALAAQLVHADRVVEEEERAFLATLCERLPSGKERGEAIISAIAALNRDSLAG